MTNPQVSLRSPAAAKRITPRLAILTLLLAASFALACSNSVSSVNPVPLVELPEDEGAHTAGIEWWYFNGHLQDETGRGYSFHFVTFQSAGTGTQAGQLLQLSWADHEARLFQSAEKVNLVAPGAVSGSFSFETSGWAMSGNGKDYALTFDTGEYSVVLKAVSLKPPVLHQGTGLVNLGPAGDTFYYTRPRLEVSGQVNVADERRAVSGIAWLDHQWGEISDREVGWDWMSLQLDGGEDLVAALVWDTDGHQPIASFGTFIDQNGEAQHLADGEIELKPLSAWTSPATGTKYPMGWEISVLRLGLSAELIPALVNAEVPKSRYGPPSYWEGAVAVAGVLGDSKVAGKGFVELVGYPEP